MFSTVFSTRAQSKYKRSISILRACIEREPDAGSTFFFFFLNLKPTYS